MIEEWLQQQPWLARGLSVVQAESSVRVGRLDVSSVEVDRDLEGAGEQGPLDLTVVDAAQDGTTVTI